MKKSNLDYTFTDLSQTFEENDYYLIYTTKEVLLYSDSGRDTVSNQREIEEHIQ